VAYVQRELLPSENPVCARQQKPSGGHPASRLEEVALLDEDEAAAMLDRRLAALDGRLAGE